MPLGKYIRFIERKTRGLQLEAGEERLGARFSIYGRVVPRNGRLELEIADQRLAQQYPAHGNVILKLINTRNELSHHVVAGLLDYQREFWNTGKESDIKALTLKQFISLFPHRRLDQSRLSRLVRTITLQNHVGIHPFGNGTSVCLRKLFVSNRRVLAHTIKEIIAQTDKVRTDKDIQTILREVHGISLSVRTICNCRKLLNIPRYKERAAHYYGRDIAFSNYVKLSEKKFHRIPAEPGVYELSISAKFDYARHKSEVIYIGSSRDLRKRIASYSGNGVKNGRLSQFLKKHEVFVRFHRIEHYRALEKALLKNFKENYGELPKCNSLGG